MGQKNKLTSELELMLTIMRDEELKEPDLQRIDWARFAQLAEYHRVYPIIYTKIKNCELMPEEVIKRLEQLYKQNTFLMLNLAMEMERISRLFLDEGIKNIQLKGPLLAKDLYGDISLRPSKDLDILIPKNKIEEAEKLLLQLGYDKLDSKVNVLNFLRWRHHHESYFHYEKRVNIELHWRLNSFPTKEPKFNELWDRRRQSTISSSSVYFLGIEDTFFQLVSHGFRHYWFRLRWLYDIHQFICKNQDMEALNSFLKKYKYDQIGRQTYLLTNEFFYTSQRSVVDILKDKPLNINEINNLIDIVDIDNQEDSKIKHVRYPYLSINEKLFYVIRLLFPKSYDEEAIRLPRYLYFLYFPLRPVLWLWRKRKNRIKINHH